MADGLFACHLDMKRSMWTCRDLDATVDPSRRGATTPSCAGLKTSPVKNTEDGLCSVSEADLCPLLTQAVRRRSQEGSGFRRACPSGPCVAIRSGPLDAG